MTRFTAFVNYLGLAAACLPVGLAEAASAGGVGLPTSVQVVARAGGERLALRVAGALELRLSEARGGPMPMPMPRGPCIS